MSGDDARQFFEQLEQIDPALFSGQFAGFTQINFAGSLTNNSMLFLQPAVSKRRFISGLAAAVAADTRTTYFPLKNNGAPTTERAGIAFPEIDWLASPDGDQSLANVGGTAQLEAELLVLQTAHRDAVREVAGGDRCRSRRRVSQSIQLPGALSHTIRPDHVRRLRCAGQLRETTARSASWIRFRR